MATYINNNVKFHGFSKSPVSPDTTLGGAVNPSGHTITTSQVRAQDIPAFLNTFAGSRADAIKWLGTNYTTPAHNDIVFYGGEFKAGFDTPKCLKYNGKTSTWEDFDLKYSDRANNVLRTTLQNADDKDVIAIHQDCSTVFVDGGNNAATNSNRWSLFVKKSDGSILDHFVASTDKIVAGMPSLGYNALVMWNKAAIDEGELDANYVGNTFAGIVHLNKQYATGDDAKFTVTCFEYIGDKLDTALTDIDEKISKVVGDAFEGAVASVTADTNTKNLGLTVTEGANPVISVTPGAIFEAKLVTGSTVKTYVDTTALADGGSIAEYVEDYVATNAKVSVNGQSATTITVAGTEESSSDIVHIKVTEDKTTTDKIGLKLTATIDAAVLNEDGSIKEDGVVIATIAEKIADSAIKDAIETDNGVIQTAIDTAISGATLNSGTQGDNQIQTSTGDAANKLVTAAQVKEYVTENAQVTVTVGTSKKTSTGFEFAGSTGTDIAVAPTMDANGKVTYAATLSKATVNSSTGAITNGGLAVSATDAKTIALAAIKEELGSTTEGSLGDTIADVKRTADSAVQSVGKDSASSSLLSVTDGTNVVISLSNEVADKTFVNTAVNGLKDTAITSQTKGGSGISITLGGKVGAPTLSGSVTTATYTPAVGTTQGQWTDSTLSNVVTGTAVKNALADVAAAHTKDIQTVTAAIEAITTSGFERIVVTELPTTDIKLNAIYLKANRESDVNEYIEYIYVGGSIVDGKVEGGSFEQIGTTKTDLTEYAKTTYVDAAVETAKDAADAAQATIDEFIAETYAADKSALEDSISGVSQVVASNHGEFTEFVNTTYAADKKALEDSVATKIATVSVTTDATHFGAEHIKSVTDASKNVTITVTRNSEWSIGSTKPANTITSVINGKMSNGNTVDDANLVNGTSMYAGNTALTTYVGSLGKLTNGTNMFSGCTGLSTFVADLTSLTTGNGMFANCKLTEESLIYIVDTLPTVTSGTITVGVADGVDKSKYVTEARTKGWTLA